MNMNTEHPSSTAPAVGLTLDEKKKRLKKSIAKMMVYWVAHSRHDLQADLIGGTPDGAWKGLALKEAFDSDEEWKEFFGKASDLFNEMNVKSGAQRISLRVHGGDGSEGDWLSELDPLCPSDPTLNVMYQAAVTFVDNNNWSGE